MKLAINIGFRLLRRKKSFKKNAAIDAVTLLAFYVWTLITVASIGDVINTTSIY